MRERFLASVRRHRLFAAPGRAILAVSGGPDSMALLDLMHSAAPELGLALAVGHVDHGIRVDSSAARDLVAGAAAARDVEFRCVQLGLGAETAETRARIERYRWLRALQRELDARYLVTAHHFDDQVETVLLRVLKGSGVAGLSGIATRGPGGLRRPLLDFRRGELREHVEREGIAYEDDPSNIDPQHLRSWVRTTLLPIAHQRLGPEVGDNVARVGRHAARARVAWDQALSRLEGLGVRPVAGGMEVARAVIAGYDKTLSVAVLRAVARRGGHVMSERAALRALRVCRGPSGKRAELGGGWVAEVAFDRLRLSRTSGVAPAPQPIDSAHGAMTWDAEWRLRWQPDVAPGTLDRVAWVTWAPHGVALTWRALQPGDRLRPLGGPGRRSVARLLMEAKVPRLARGRYPLLVSNDEVLWIPGVCRGEAALPTPGSRAVRIDAASEHLSTPDGRS